MNKIKYYIILATITLFTLNGCGNWLDVSPKNQVNYLMTILAFVMH